MPNSAAANLASGGVSPVATFNEGGNVGGGRQRCPYLARQLDGERSVLGNGAVNVTAHLVGAVACRTRLHRGTGGRPRLPAQPFSAPRAPTAAPLGARAGTRVRALAFAAELGAEGFAHLVAVALLDTGDDRRASCGSDALAQTRRTAASGQRARAGEQQHPRSTLGVDAARLNSASRVGGDHDHGQPLADPRLRTTHCGRGGGVRRAVSVSRVLILLDLRAFPGLHGYHRRAAGAEGPRGQSRQWRSCAGGRRLPSVRTFTTQRTPGGNNRDSRTARSGRRSSARSRGAGRRTAG